MLTEMQKRKVKEKNPKCICRWNSLYRCIFFNFRKMTFYNIK